MKKIKNILASASPRRKNLLEKIGFTFDVKPSNITENLNLNLEPADFSKYWAHKKAQQVAKEHINSIVIGADTIVTINNKVLGKPKNRDDSISMLRMLSGETHQVITGMCLINNKLDFSITYHTKTKVYLNPYNDKEIIDYIDNENPNDKAGSYGIQDSFAKHVRKIDGCFYNVMGLPLAKFYKNYNRMINKILENDTYN